MTNRSEGKCAVVPAAAAGRVGRACAIYYSRARGRSGFTTDINEAGIATLGDLSTASPRQPGSTCATTRRCQCVSPRAPGEMISCSTRASASFGHGTILDCSEEDFDFSVDLQRQIHASHQQGLLCVCLMISERRRAASLAIWSCAALRFPLLTESVMSGSSSGAAVLALTLDAVALDFINQGIRAEQEILARHCRNPSMLDRARCRPR